MKQIALVWIYLAVMSALVLANNHRDSLTLSPSAHSVVRYTNESLIVQCRSPSSDTKIQWKSPKGEVITEHKGRIHIEHDNPETLKIVFSHILLTDKGNWTCEVVEDSSVSKSFDLIVYQKITFTENATVLTVKEGKNATILCEVKGEPQPNITWNFNGQPITVDTNSTKYRILADGLLIHKVTQNDTGEYTCRAYQVNSIASDMQERTVLMKIEHKPFWTKKLHMSLQYAYLNGSASIACEAIAEPPANFTWFRNKKRLHNDKHYSIETDQYMSTLTIQVHDASVFDTYKCRVQNNLGSIERNTILEQGVKPPPPDKLSLRGFNSNTLDVDVGSIRSSPKRDPMEVNGFRIEYITEHEFKADGAKWTNAKRKDFPFEEGATFLINNLEANTTYLMRAATRNLAGLSDWTKVESFTTQPRDPSSAGLRLTEIAFAPIFSCVLIVLVSNNFQVVSSLTKFTKYVDVH